MKQILNTSDAFQNFSKLHSDTMFFNLFFSWISIFYLKHLEKLNNLELLSTLNMRLSSEYFRIEHFGQTQNTNVTCPDASDVFREICNVGLDHL